MTALSLTFKETMSGYFALGTGDAAEGAQRGKQNGTTLAIHVDVGIDDLDRFINDPEHPGSLTGTIDFPPLGMGIEALTGVFNLFKPTNNPDMTYMVYELAFQHLGEDYYLAGHKEIRDDSGFDLWSDTTTLYTTLHQGKDKSGPVVGAGILTLGIKQLADLIASIDVPNADGPLAKASAVEKFGRFFAGKLWDTYVIPKFGRQHFDKETDDTLHYDVIVIGSGFGGAVTACRLAEKGMKVCILERGRRWDAKDYPRGPGDAWWWSHEEPAKCNGWIDIRFYKHMAVAQGCGVGGGSLIYANIFVEAERFAFESGWPPEITYETLKPYYEKTGKMLNVQEVPDNQWPPKMKLMKDAAERCGYRARFRKMPLAVNFDPEFSYDRPDAFDDKHSKPFVNPFGLEQGTCVHCGNCDIGCQVKARNTLDLNYIPLAEKHGAVVKPLHLVRRITPLHGKTGYRVDFDVIDPDAQRLIPGHLNAKKLILAAGTMGTNELLLRCRDQYGTLPDLSDMLGVGWSSNGDFLTPALYKDRQISPTRGPIMTSAIDFLDGFFRKQRFWVQDGGFPNLIKDALQDLSNDHDFGHFFSALKSLNQGSDPLSAVMPWFGQAVDASDGVLKLSRSWIPPFRHKLELEWNVKNSEGAVQALIDMHKTLSESTGGEAVVPPSWEVLKDLITPHPLGGCRMGTGIKDGVVDHKGEVFGYPGLYVADGAIIPRALGLNPARTIAALAERIADFIEP
ncbi:GMC oxidoreductase [Methylocaldum szegediense]|uniref:Cholesterol oxidase n=1 Tax=Methylocaldum szegediense TaxID=73780 RepID=A0ABM9I4W3_9GAMM|nr:GMC family oxidoreductase [Methylocaldum szegediense]CAI8893930.1 cholesterol oxidase [Methylocaldum szegediense]